MSCSNTNRTATNARVDAPALTSNTSSPSSDVKAQLSGDKSTCYSAPIETCCDSAATVARKVCCDANASTAKSCCDSSAVDGGHGVLPAAPRVLQEVLARELLLGHAELGVSGVKVDRARRVVEVAVPAPSQVCTCWLVGWLVGTLRKIVHILP